MPSFRDIDTSLHRVEDPRQLAQQSQAGAASTAAAMTRDIRTPTQGKTIGGGIASGISGFAAGSALTGATTATGLGLASNPVGWAIGAGMLASYMLS